MGGSAAVIMDIVDPAAVDAATAGGALDAATADATANAAADEAAQTAAYNTGSAVPNVGPVQDAGPLTDSSGNPLPSTPSSSSGLPSNVTNALTNKAISSGLNALTGGTSGTTGTSGTSGTTGTSGSSGTSGTSNLPTANTPSTVNLTPGLTSRESSTINPFGAEFAAPTAVNQYVKEGGHIQHYYGGGGVNTNPEMPNQGQRPMLLRGHPGANLAPPSAHSMLNVAPHFADGGHVPEFYSEGGMHNRFVKGEGDGTSDDVPAMLANGEFVIPADVVSSLGNGSNDSGAKVLDSFLETIRAHKTAHDPKKLPPDSKGALGYLADAHKKVKA